MPKQCINAECNAFLEDVDGWCGRCGTHQPLQISSPKKQFSLFKKKEQKIIPVKNISPGELEDFRMSPEMKMIQKQKEKENDYSERLESIENKLDIILKNNNWLLINVDAWLQGYKKAVEQEEDTESNK